MIRFLEYFKGVSFKQRRIHISSTGAVIEINKQFKAGALSVIKIYFYFLAKNAKQVFTKRGDRRSIAFYPHSPGPWYNVWQVIRLSGLKLHSDYKKADYIFVFEDSTFTSFDSDFSRGLNTTTLNHRVNDISKEHVTDIFEAVFKYSLRIDPAAFKGPAIKKSNANGMHDGVIIECPVDVTKGEPNFVYQRLIDSTFDGVTSEDLRVAYVLGEIALVYHKKKPLNDRFGTQYLSVDVKSAADVFFNEEIGLIIKFCEKMGLDFGALDIMRDKHDGRIYIVDVNKTCMPVLCLSLKQQIRCQQKIANALNRGLSKKAL